MPTFTIYLKKGKSFELTFAKFEHRENTFTLYDSPNQEMLEGFLLFEPVAAIVPKDQRYSDKIEPYRIHLKNNQHVDIYAHAFSNAEGPSIKFYVKLSDAGEPREVKDVYVATSEVIAITPAQGLRTGRSRSLED